MNQAILLLTLFAVALSRPEPSQLVGPITIDYDITRDGIKAANASNTNEDILWEALSKLRMEMKWSFTFLVPEQVIQATSQVDASGKKYTWTVLLASSNCGKDIVTSKSMCRPDISERKELYVVTFVDSPKNQSYRLDRLDSREPIMTGKIPREDCSEAESSSLDNSYNKNPVETLYDATKSGGKGATANNTLEKELWAIIANPKFKMNTAYYFVPIKIEKVTRQRRQMATENYIYEWTMEMGYSSCPTDGPLSNKDRCKATVSSGMYTITQTELNGGAKSVKIKKIGAVHQ